MHITERKKPIEEGYIPYNVHKRTFWERQNQGDNKELGGCQGSGGRVDRDVLKAVRLFHVTLSYGHMSL